MVSPLFISSILTFFQKNGSCLSATAVQMVIIMDYFFRFTGQPATREIRSRYF